MEKLILNPLKEGDKIGFYFFSNNINYNNINICKNEYRDN